MPFEKIVFMAAAYSSVHKGFLFPAFMSVRIQEPCGFRGGKQKRFFLPMLVPGALEKRTALLC